MFEEDMVDQKKEEEEALMVGRMFFITEQFDQENNRIICRMYTTLGLLSHKLSVLV